MLGRADHVFDLASFGLAGTKVELGAVVAKNIYFVRGQFVRGMNNGTLLLKFQG